MTDEHLDTMIRRLSNWGRWGDDDEIGTVNLITPEVRQRALQSARTGEVVSLAIVFDRNGPQPAGDRRPNTVHSMIVSGVDLKAGVHPFSVGGWGHADDLVTMATHGATHWDTLAHQFFDFRMYNDRDCTLVSSDGAACCAVTAFAPRIVTRGVLLDVPRALGVEWLAQDQEITVAELERTLELQHVELRSGDVLLIRTGNMLRARRGGGWDSYAYADEPGIGLEALPWLHAHEIAGVASDTWAFEVLPNRGEVWLPVHAVGIVHMGLLIGEMFELDELARACASDGMYDFLLSALPLPLAGAVGGPVHPVAIR